MEGYKIEKINGAEINEAAIKELTFEAFMGDAFARNSEDAKNYLREKYNAKRKDGNPMPFTKKCKVEYLKKFCGYVEPTMRPKGKTREEKFDSMLAAFEALANAPATETTEE